MLALRALGALLSYPTPLLRQALPEIAAALNDCQYIPASCQAALRGLVEELAAMDQLEAEERYVDLFDRGRATSLNLFEHLHGDARDRGQAMVELRELYNHAGFGPSTNELPDFLPVLLEYLSCREKPEIRTILEDCAHILRDIGEALLKRDRHYAAVLQAVLAIAGAAPLDAMRAAKRPSERVDLDREWAERPAFERDAAPSVPPIGASAASGR